MNLQAATIEQFKHMRDEETLEFHWNETHTVVSVIRRWRGTATHQLEGPAAELDDILRCVLPKSKFRDEHGYEPASYTGPRD